MEHHKRQAYCTTRLKYRQGRELKAVKVYSCANESCHLLIFGVPKVDLHQEVKQKFQRYGTVKLIECITNESASLMELELFTDVFHIHYDRIESARRAKRFLDAQQFYGGILHISYAPERETIEQLRLKLTQRREDVARRLIILNRKERRKQPKE